MTKSDFEEVRYLKICSPNVKPSKHLLICTQKVKNTHAQKNAGEKIRWQWEWNKKNPRRPFANARRDRSAPRERESLEGKEGKKKKRRCCISRHSIRLQKGLWKPRELVAAAFTGGPLHSAGSSLDSRQRITKNWMRDWQREESGWEGKFLFRHTSVRKRRVQTVPSRMLIFEIATGTIR